MPQLTSGRGRKAVSSVDSRLADSSEAAERQGSSGATGRPSPGSAHPAEPGHRKTRGLSNWRLSRKLIAAFILPTVAALFLAGLRVQDGFANIAVYQRAQQRVVLATKVASTVGSLQEEREELAAWIASGRPGDRARLNQRIASSEAAARRFRDAMGDVATIGDDATTSRYEQALTRLNGLAQLRLSAGAVDFPALAAQESYAGVVNALQRVAQEFGADVTDKGLQTRHDTLVLLSDAKEYSAQQSSYLHGAAAKGQFEPAELKNITTAQSNLLATIDRFNAAATPRAQLDYANTVTGPQVSQRFQLQQLALLRASAASPLPLAIDPAVVASSSQATLDLIAQVENRLLDEAANHAAGLVGAEQRSLIITSGVMIGLLALALVLMSLVARSMLRPLRTLRITALQVADQHLPEAVERIMRESDPRAVAASAIDPVPVHTTEEIGQVARAFDIVHGQAVRLAAEQAVLRENVRGIFVNLSRRSQRLVERELDVIDRLEVDEQDPDRLSSLFELDHLATQLRRNGESLLVLSGAGLAKSVQRTVPAGEVIGAAVSEIEQYARVEVGEVPEVAVQGLAVHDLMHLLAELLDNATYFSEPDTKITMRAVVTRQQSLAIQITDCGVGMSEEQFEAANRGLADPPELDVSVTRRMGLYVVAKLAQRHGIEVRLRENQDDERGVIARIVVPGRLLTPIPPAPPQVRVPDRSHVETSQSSMPPVPARETGQRRPEEQSSVGELTPLEQPISLDDLVAGSTSSAAGPFLDRPPEESRMRPRAVPSVPTDLGPPSADADDGPVSPLALLKREPRYIPVEQDEDGPPGSDNGDDRDDASAPDDDVTTKRLPIYQSVLSRWFNEVVPAAGEKDDGAPTTEATVSGSLPADELRQGSGYPTDDDVTGDDAGWSNASDLGWQAAHALLDSAAEQQVTPAGLPKRVPNANLVPGSIPPASQPDADAAPMLVKSVPRSATAARGRMVSFQRGYTSGRHAVENRSHETNDTSSSDRTGKGNDDG